MSDWFVFAIFSFISYGIFGLVAKLSANTLPPSNAALYDIFGVAIIGVIAVFYFFFLSPGFQLETRPVPVLFGLLTGITGLMGTIFLLLALGRGGQASIVVPLTALYPLLTAILAFVILKEAISLRQGLGMGFALVAIWLMAK
jgi:bacterial/archaeal transporter family protein